MANPASALVSASASAYAPAPAPVTKPKRVKVSLREFQRSLAERVAGAKSTASIPARLGVQAGKGFWLIDLTEAGEIVPLPEILSVPLTKPWFAGVANIRGNLVSVVDFAGFAGHELTARTVDSRLLLAGTKHGINAALLVSRMMGLRNVGQLKRQEGFENSQSWVGAGFSDDEGRLWHELRIGELVRHADFLQVGA